MKTILKIILFISIPSTFLTLPAFAQLGGVWKDFQLYTIDLQDYLKNNIYTTLKLVEVETINEINDSTGTANLPNPIQVRGDMTESIVVNSQSDIFERNPSIKAITTSNEIDRQITRASVSALFGSKGQERLQNKLEATENVLSNISNIANNLEENNSGFLDDIQGSIEQFSGVGFLAPLFSAQTNLQMQAIKIEGEQSKLIGENLYQAININNSLQYSNLNLANISKQIEEENRARRVNSSAEAARLLRLSSQADLLGRRKDLD